MAGGRAPKIRVTVKNRITGKIETGDVSLELHHRTLPQRMGSGAHNEAWNLEIVNRWAHEAMDQFRYAGWDLVKILKGDGEIYLDAKLIQKDGKFVARELKGLN